MRHIESFCIKPEVGSRGGSLYCFKGQLDKSEICEAVGTWHESSHKRRKTQMGIAMITLLIKPHHRIWYYVSPQLRARSRSHGCAWVEVKCPKQWEDGLFLFYTSKSQGQMSISRGLILRGLGNWKPLFELQLKEWRKENLEPWNLLENCHVKKKLGLICIIPKFATKASEGKLGNLQSI